MRGAQPTHLVAPWAAGAKPYSVPAGQDAQRGLVGEKDMAAIAEEDDTRGEAIERGDAGGNLHLGIAQPIHRPQRARQVPDREAVDVLVLLGECAPLASMKQRA